MLRHTIKQGDREPSLTLAVANKVDGSALDLTGASIFMRMQNDVGELVIDNGAASITTDDDGRTILVHPWAEGETATHGEHFAEFVVTRSGKPETFPAGSYIRVSITQNLGAQE